MVAYWKGKDLYQPHNRQIAAFALGYPLELDSETLLLKKPHTLVIEHGEIKLVLSWKLHPYWLHFVILQDAIDPATGEEKSSDLTYATLVSYNNDSHEMICLLMQ